MGRQLYTGGGVFLRVGLQAFEVLQKLPPSLRQSIYFLLLAHNDVAELLQSALHVGKLYFQFLEAVAGIHCGRLTGQGGKARSASQSSRRGVP